MPVIRIVEDKAQVDGGHAIVVVQGVEQYRGDGTLAIRRLGYEAANLSPEGWRVPDARLTAERYEIRDGALHLYLGPDVTEFLTPDDHVSIEVNGVLGSATVAWPPITPHYGGRTQFRRVAQRPVPPPPPPQAPPQAPLPPPAPVPDEEPTVFVPLPPPPPPPEPAKEEETVRPERMVDVIDKPKPMNLAWLGPALWCLLSLAIGAAAYANRQHEDVAGTVPPVAGLPETPSLPPSPPALPEPPATPPGVPPVGELPPANPPPTSPPPLPPPPPEDQSVQEIVRAAGSAQEIFDWAQKFRARGDYQGMLLLLENAAERGSVEAMMEIARLYDPATFIAGQPFSKANPSQAAKFYRKAEAAGSAEAGPALAALKKRLDALAAQGDADAKAALATYWPGQ